MAELQSLHDVLLHELHDLYSAEQQLVEALPKMAEAATEAKLKKAFKDHLVQTKGHVKRLEGAFKALNEKPKAVFCKGMHGLVQEGGELLDKEKGPALDAALISAAQRVEHYEMAAYGCACEYAKLMKHTAALKLLKLTIKEEGAADDLLTKIAKIVNKKANDMQEQKM
jgi:ferritin-like metal-binding protein YciE